MAISPISANFAGSISTLSAIQPLDVKDNALLDLLIRDRFVGNDFVNVRPGAFATPTAPATPAAPTGSITTGASINLAHVAPGDLITAPYINELVDALLALDKRLAKIEAAPRQTAPTPPIVATPVPPATVIPNFTFTLANELATIEIPATEIEAANEIRIGEIVIPRNEVTIEGGIARFSAPSALFRAGADKTPDLTLAATGAPTRVFAGLARPIQ